LAFIVRFAGARQSLRQKEHALLGDGQEEWTYGSLGTRQLRLVARRSPDRHLVPDLFSRVVNDEDGRSRVSNIEEVVQRKVRSAVLMTALGCSLVLSSTSAMASPPKLSSELLSVGQMPSGWSVDVQTGGSAPGCLARLFEPKGSKQTSHATVNFVYNGNLPLISEKLGTYSNATTAYKKIVSTLSDCTSVRGVSGSQKVTGTIGRLTMPSYGDASAAFAVKLTIQGTKIANDIVIVRKGGVVMGVEEAGPPPVNVSQLRGVVSKALKKLP
jgi:hypothetical protein